jgi:hypothetical protein
MNTQKNVNQRLSKLYTQDAKQELSSEKIELALKMLKALNDFVLRSKAAMIR